MKQIDFVDLFDRSRQKNEFLDFLSSFDVSQVNQPKGLYLIGPPGSGKTEFIKSIIDKERFDIIYYDSNDVRTKTAIPTIIGDKSSNMNVLGLFYKKKKQLITIMDEMDYMSSGDKGGIKELIKYVRQKKTKKQLSEPQSSSPIIFIGSNNNDKKIKELINVCKFIQIYKPTNEQVGKYIRIKLPELKDENLYNELVIYADSNLSKLKIIFEIYNKNPSSFSTIMKHILYKSSNGLFTKSVISSLFTKYVPISNYSQIVRETDRTTLGLLWHENVGSVVTNKNLTLYKKILDNLCVSDYIDRVIFQNQIWELSELNSFIKTFYNNYLLHNSLEKVDCPSEIIFTKVLTKYSTEYNNYCFLQQLEQKMFCSKSKILHQFMIKNEEELKEKYYLTSLDVDRMKRFIKNGEFTCV